MGYKKPSDLPIYRPLPTRAWTVGEMIAVGWTVRARCHRCWRTAAVDLKKVMQKRGARISLWDHRQRCPYDACGGIVSFQARTNEQAEFWDLKWHRLEKDGGWTA